MESLVLDGVALPSEFKVAVLERPFATPTPVTQFVHGGGRYALRGVDLVPPQISFRVIAREMTAAQRQARADALAPLLVRDGAVRVAFGSDGGRYYEAVPSGPLDLHQFVSSGSVDVTMTCLEAAMYGDEKVATVPSGGSVTFEVGGTYPTKPTITAASAVRNSSSLLWGVRLDGGDFLHVETGSSSSRSVVLDCAAGTCKLAGAAHMATLDSDWFEMRPGSHTVRMDNGTGAAVVRWQERWL